jgi:hypothetical protein
MLMYVVNPMIWQCCLDACLLDLLFMVPTELIDDPLAIMSDSIGL